MGYLFHRRDTGGACAPLQAMRLAEELVQGFAVGGAIWLAFQLEEDVSNSLAVFGFFGLKRGQNLGHDFFICQHGFLRRWWSTSTCNNERYLIALVHTVSSECCLVSCRLFRFVVDNNTGVFQQEGRVNGHVEILINAAYPGDAPAGGR